MSDKIETLNLSTRLRYSITEAGLLIVSFVFSSQMMYFMTDILKISAASAGTMFLVTRIWDAINDPIMGVIADRNKSRFGQYRPFILIGGIPLVITLVLAFTDMGFSSTGSLIYTYIMYTLFGMSYTCIFIPYTTMVGNLATTPEERSSLSSMKGAFSALGVLIASLLTVPLVTYFGGEGSLNAKGFKTVTLLYAVIVMILFTITFATVKERKRNIVEVKPYKLNFSTFIEIILKNRNLVFATLMYFFIYFRMFVNNSTVNYFFVYQMKKPQLIPFYMAMVSGFNIISSFFVPRLAVKFGKRRLTMFGLLLSAIGYIFFYMVRFSSPAIFFIVVAAMNFVCAPAYLLIWGIVADVADNTEKEKGFRADGLLYSSTSFMNKFAGALAGAVSGFVLSATGYMAGVEQTTTALFGIDILMFAIPGLSMLLASGCMALYKLE